MLLYGRRCLSGRLERAIEMVRAELLLLRSN